MKTGDIKALLTKIQIFHYFLTCAKFKAKKKNVIIN